MKSWTFAGQGVVVFEVHAVKLHTALARAGRYLEKHGYEKPTSCLGLNLRIIEVRGI